MRKGTTTVVRIAVGESATFVVVVGVDVGEGNMRRPHTTKSRGGTEHTLMTIEEQRARLARTDDLLARVREVIGPDHRPRVVAVDLATYRRRVLMLARRFA